MKVDVQRSSWFVWIVSSLFGFFHACRAANGFNAVFLATIDANVTCGNPKEIYYRTQEGVLHPRERTPLVCDASDPGNSHPPGNMIDGDLASFWQSQASMDEAIILIDFSQVRETDYLLYIHHVSFMYSMRARNTFLCVL